MPVWMHQGFSKGHTLAIQAYDYLEDIQPGLAKKVFGGVIGSATVSYLAWRGYRYYSNRVVVRERGLAGKAAIQTLANHLVEVQDREGPVDAEKEAMIVDLSMTALQEKLQKGELKALEVLRAYQRKALKVNDRLNCITEPIFEAEAQATELDMIKPSQRRPLHGIPMSVKESIGIEGYDCNAGYAFFANQPVKRDADIVKVMKSLGAVPFVRTNFPQGLMTFACSNPIFGCTVNPHDSKRGPGGSSGGEGSLIGGGGSIMGLGSDIGGSIRIPCQFCGVYGLKPTVDRMATKGHIPLSSGQTLVRPTVGPMARDMDGLVKMSREIFTSPKMHQLDTTVAPLTFNEELFEKKGPLRIGYYRTLKGAGSVHPACVRAVLKAKDILATQHGYTLIEFEPVEAYEAVRDLYMKAVFGDDSEDGADMMKHEVLDRCVMFSYYVGHFPAKVRYMVAKLIELFGDRQVGQIGKSISTLPRTVCEWWQLQDKISAYKEKIREQWEAQKLDALIGPGLPYPAITTGTEDNVLGGITYTTLYNLLNYPAGSMPITTVTSADVDQLKDPSVYPRCGAMEKFIIKDSEGSVGLPMGVQVIAQPYHEEMVLRVMKNIDLYSSEGSS